MAIITGLSRDPYTTLFDVFDGVWLSKKAVLWTSVGVLEHPNIPIPIGTYIPCRQCRDGSIPCALNPYASTPPNEEASIGAYGDGDCDRDDQHGMMDHTMHRRSNLLRHDEKMDY